MSTPAPLASLAPASESRPHEHLVVRVGPERFALPLAAVAEAIDAPAIRAIAGTDAGCLGFVAWRGRQLAVRRATEAFGHEAVVAGGAAIVLVGAACAVAVDEVLDAVPLPPDRVRAVRGLRDPLRAVAGVARDAAGLVTVLRASAVHAACAPAPVSGGSATTTEAA